jgi:hypothetical protein
MASPAQITANQQNASHSTGPNTGAGKETCSRNAVTHGLTAKKLVLSVEEQSEYDEVRQGFLEAWRPKTEYEHILFEDAIRAHWFWSRAQCAHTAVLEAIMQEERKADPKLDSTQALARVFTEDKHAKRLRLLMRYEAAAERTYRKSHTELQRAITARVSMETRRQMIKQAAELRAGGFAAPSTPAPDAATIGSVSHVAAPQRR